MSKRPTIKLSAAQQQNLRKQNRRLRQLELVMRRHPDADRDDVWHTLIALENPWANLERSLLRGRGVEIHFR
jgi:hypothetical protein